MDEAECGVSSVVLAAGLSVPVSGMVVIVLLARKSLDGVSAGWDVFSVEVIEGISVVCGTVPRDRG